MRCYADWRCGPSWSPASRRWPRRDASEHREVLAAVHEGRAADAERLMAGHVRRAVHHWEPERHGTGGTKNKEYQLTTGARLPHNPTRCFGVLAALCFDE